MEYRQISTYNAEMWLMSDIIYSNLCESVNSLRPTIKLNE